MNGTALETNPVGATETLWHLAACHSETWHPACPVSGTGVWNRSTTLSSAPSMYDNNEAAAGHPVSLIHITNVTVILPPWAILQICLVHHRNYLLQVDCEHSLPFDCCPSTVLPSGHLNATHFQFHFLASHVLPIWSDSHTTVRSSNQSWAMRALSKHCVWPCPSIFLVSCVTVSSVAI